MGCYQLQNISFTYPKRTRKALDNLSLTIERGSFVTLCGKSGCGKTTLLRLLKPSLTPHGCLEGQLLFNGEPITTLDAKEQAAQIGFVLQNPDNQIVTDKVWHELAFGLESLGYPTAEIRARVSEMASFFGIQNWFHKSVSTLSGGQKQLLNLASVMVLQPSVLILDEPTAQLDPIAAQEFLNTLGKIHRELGITVILSEHRLEDALPLSDRVLVLDEGKLVADGTPREVGMQLKKHPLFSALPTPVRIYGAVVGDGESPLTVGDGRKWLEEYAHTHPLDAKTIPEELSVSCEPVVLSMKDVWFRYGRELPDVIKGLCLKVCQGEFLALVGGNGTGKTTALSLLAGLQKPYRGKVERKDCKNVVLLPQQPQTLFLKPTVYEDLYDVCREEEELRAISGLCRIGHLLEAHPYDLSGGEQQRVALAKVLLCRPDVLLLDEPTKGMDVSFKEVFATMITELKANGVTIVMVSHDIEFCAAYADRCALFFDGDITASDTPRRFFSGKSFYTTAANRMARTILPEAVLAEDVIRACGGTTQKTKPSPPTLPTLPKKEPEQKSRSKRKGFGWFLVCAFLLAELLIGVFALSQTTFVKVSLIALASGAAVCLFPPGKPMRSGQARKCSFRTLALAVLVLLAAMLTVGIGTTAFGGRRYYAISVLVLLEILLPFFLAFERRKPKARELVMIGVLCALGVSGRVAFFMLPQFKPTMAIVILSGVCFGAEPGFLVGAMTAFVSNFFFGQGPWTPWQMVAFGIVGFLAGLLFGKEQIQKLSLSLFGGLATIVLYGGIMNPASVLLSQTDPTAKQFVAAYLAGLPLDLIHGVSTAFFLWFIASPMLEKLERIKTKYGLQLS